MASDKEIESTFMNYCQTYCIMDISDPDTEIMKVIRFAIDQIKETRASVLEEVKEKFLEITQHRVSPFRTNKDFYKWLEEQVKK